MVARMAARGCDAFAAPGGFIFISRGMLRCCRGEDELAAVLAHEIGHVQCGHGIQAIRKSRYTGAVTTILLETGKSLSNQEVAQLTEAFEGTITDITGTMMNSGYARSAERQADQAAVIILRRAGYDPHALVVMLAEMKQRLKPGGRDFAKTHPSPDVRIAELQKILSGQRVAVSATAQSARQVRFRQALGSI